MGAKDAVGRYGEKVAATHLVEAGWTVLERNWRGTGGELDVVALDGDVLVAVEVKTRRGTGYGHPAEAVTARKLARLRRLTGEWLATHDVRAASVRVDVLAVVVPRAGAARVEHLRGVSA
ncbi:YraN family protein [Cellulosimicrobium marinum]|uniref:YraN family protein n=1 Tax=Cellulosimicrobium marinum TaxID=1638992 RepID=UPI001E563507|nr:YraN family protein [Cellulosimicrobium marinum]MCB7137685.1 YraN family protein [Cellulosimicrobium marinum]